MHTAIYVLAGVGVWAICTLFDAAVVAIVITLSGHNGRNHGK